MAALVALSFTSCKKCRTCTEKNSAGDVEYTWPEVCGKKKDVDKYEDSAKAAVDPGNTVTCSDD